MQSEDKWLIDIDWLEANDRSFSVMAANYLCPKCRKKLKVDKVETTAADILKSLKSCCSKSDEFITADLPLQESAFRVLLGNGNKPMPLEEIGRELNIRRGVDTYRTAPTVLYRLINNDRHYGFKALRD
ncbi:MAG: hypothetical protein PHE50_03465 [Dehalococcoidales bacterium]|nr:hypothetical protein [Dehalococcoidales bacterium]